MMIYVINISEKDTDHKIILDANIFIEYFEERQHFESVRLLFNVLEDGMHTGYISIGSLKERIQALFR